MKIKIILLFVFLIFLAISRIVSLPIGHYQTVFQSKKDGYYDYQGVIHFHTQYSGDATGSFEEIAAAANRQRIDFMISTDHDTLKPLEDHKEGWYQNTLILVGEELSLPEGYLLALNIKPSNFSGLTTGEIISAIGKQGGMVFIAHPDHPNWRWIGGMEPGITGEEILDFADQWYSASPGSLLLSLMIYPFNSSAALVELYDRPDETLMKWDRMNQDRQLTGIFAPDFHQAIRITDHYKFPFPKAEIILQAAHDHLILQTPFSGNLGQDKALLLDAIRKGHLYIAMDLLGNASGFLFLAKQGDQKAWMGDQLKAGRDTDFIVNLPDSIPFKHVLIHLYRNGEEIAQSADSRLDFRDKRTGVYRVEVESEIPTFWGTARKVVWIYSNPIYLREGKDT